jgi:rhodanese-related sulfurtransferase
MSDGEPRGFSVEEARELVAGAEGGRAAVVDLRGEDDFGEGHIPSATRIEDPSAEDLEQVERGSAEVEWVLLVCEDGKRSAERARELAGGGRDVGWLEGGMKGWSGPLQPRPEVEFEGPKKQSLY